MSSKATMVQKVKEMETSQIIDVWDMLNAMETIEEIYLIRGVIIDELENRNANAFEEWLDSEQDSPRVFF